MFVGWAGLVQYMAIVGVHIIYFMFSFQTKFGNRLLSVSAVIGGGVIDLVRSAHLFFSTADRKGVIVNAWSVVLYQIRYKRRCTRLFIV